MIIDRSGLGDGKCSFIPTGMESPPKGDSDAPDLTMGASGFGGQFVSLYLACEPSEEEKARGISGE